MGTWGGWLRATERPNQEAFYARRDRSFTERAIATTSKLAPPVGTRNFDVLEPEVNWSIVLYLNPLLELWWCAMQATTQAVGRVFLLFDCVHAG